MNHSTQRILTVRALLAAARDTLDLLTTDDPDAPTGEEERELVAASAMIASRFLPRSRADSLRFVHALQAGDEAWLVVHSVKNEHRAEATYWPHLPPDIRRAIDS